MATPTRPAAAPVSRELEDYRQQVQAVQQRAAQLTLGLDNTAGVWRPAPRCWSIAECLDHLNVTAEVFLPALHRAIDGGIAASGEPRGPHRGWVGGWILRVVEPPPQKRFRAPKRAQPRAHLELDQVEAHFQQLQREILACLTRAEGVDLAKTRLGHPMFALLRLSLSEMFGVLVAHERRHLWQAEQVLAAPGFPRQTS